MCLFFVPKEDYAIRNVGCGIKVGCSSKRHTPIGCDKVGDNDGTTLIGRDWLCPSWLPLPMDGHY